MSNRVLMCIYIREARESERIYSFFFFFFFALLSFFFFFFADFSTGDASSASSSRSRFFFFFFFDGVALDSTPRSASISFSTLCMTSMFFLGGAPVS